MKPLYLLCAIAIVVCFGCNGGTEPPIGPRVPQEKETPPPPVKKAQEPNRPPVPIEKPPLPPLEAYDPKPPDEAKSIDPDSVLSWIPDPRANRHESTLVPVSKVFKMQPEPGC